MLHVRFTPDFIVGADDHGLMHSQTFALRPISPAAADALRRQGGPEYTADEFPGFPCRQCLKDAAVGDELILVSRR